MRLNTISSTSKNKTFAQNRPIFLTSTRFLRIQELSQFFSGNRQLLNTQPCGLHPRKSNTTRHRHHKHHNFGSIRHPMPPDQHLQPDLEPEIIDPHAFRRHQPVQLELPVPAVQQQICQSIRAGSHDCESIDRPDQCANTGDQDNGQPGDQSDSHRCD